MKYEFHVGDYVETVGGFIGWVSYVDQDYITIKSNEGIMSGPWSIPEELYHFNRIGQYDFTKKDEDKIEKIDIKKTGGVFTGRETVIIDIISNKINELIETINRLKEKVNEMVQS